jgi:transcriptional regulator with XRE-family HTH domain
MSKEKIKNELEIIRRGRGLSRKEVSRLLGYRGTSALSKYERGISMPPLQTALGLEIILRSPIAFLWPSRYRDLQEQIRTQEGEQHA